MDVQKSGLLNLGSFPPDIWAYVVWYLPGEQIGRLKMTGSRSLWSKLTHHQVVKSVGLGTDYIQFKSWPAFLNECPSIEELCITSRSGDWWSKSCFTLSDVPRTLRKLAIKGLITRFANFFLDGEGACLSFKNHVPRLEVLDVSAIQCEDYSWVKLLPPSLTDLKIRRWDENVELPDSLIHLTVTSNKTKSGRLPPGLESIVIDRIPDLSLLASPLASLKLEMAPYIDKFGVTELIKSLPKTLMEFEYLNALLPINLWPSLPLMLKKLICSVELFPDTEELNDSPRTDFYPIELLPRSLTHLELNSSDLIFLHLDPKNPSSSSTFPPSLTTLSLPGFHLSPTAAKHLPDSLTDLLMMNFCKSICEHLPRGLRRLRARSTLMSPELINHLPRSLRVLELTSAAGGSVWFYYETGKEVAVSSMREEFAIHKKFASLCFQMDPLPPNLTSLILREYNIQDDFASQKLPNLLDLEIVNTKVFSDRAIPLLNRHLTRLCLPRSERITGKCFAFLPRGLTSLSFGLCSSVDDSDIQHLPRSLTALYLNSATSLTDRSIKDFPRGLRFLLLNRNLLITVACFPDLPYPLQSSSNTFFVAKFKNENGAFKVF